MKRNRKGALGSGRVVMIRSHQSWTKILACYHCITTPLWSAFGRKSVRVKTTGVLGQPPRPGPGRLAAALGPCRPGLQQGLSALLSEGRRLTKCEDRGRRGSPGPVCHPGHLRTPAPVPPQTSETDKQERAAVTLFVILLPHPHPPVQLKLCL